MRIKYLAAIAALIFSGAAHAEDFRLQSPAFQANGAMPQKYTCEGDNVSPPLIWSGVPGGTQSLALIVDDPDAPDPAKPTKDVSHWVLYNVRPAADKLEAATSLPSGAAEGLNEKGEAEYMGPCPPIGKHRYFFRLYALNSTLDFHEPPTRAAVEQAIKGHMLRMTSLVGTYEKAKK